MLPSSIDASSEAVLRVPSLFREFQKACWTSGKAIQIQSGKSNPNHPFQQLWASPPSRPAYPFLFSNRSSSFRHSFDCCRDFCHIPSNRKAFKKRSKRNCLLSVLSIWQQNDWAFDVFIRRSLRSETLIYHLARAFPKSCHVISAWEWEATFY